MRQTIKDYREKLRWLYSLHNTANIALDRVIEQLTDRDACDPDILTEATQAVRDSRTEATLENIEHLQNTLRNRYDRNLALMMIAEDELSKTPDEILNELKATEEN